MNITVEFQIYLFVITNVFSYWEFHADYGVVIGFFLIQNRWNITNHPTQDHTHTHWQYFSKCAVLLHISNLQPEMTFHCTLIGIVLVVSDVPPALIQPIIPHGNRIELVHIHLYQVPFSMCWPCRCVIDEKYYLLNFQFYF